MPQHKRKGIGGKNRRHKRKNRVKTTSLAWSNREQDRLTSGKPIYPGLHPLVPRETKAGALYKVHPQTPIKKPNPASAGWA